MKILGLVAILIGIVLIISNLVTSIWNPAAFMLLALILIVGGFFLYRGTFARPGR